MKGEETLIARLRTSAAASRCRLRRAGALPLPLSPRLCRPAARRRSPLPGFAPCGAGAAVASPPPMVTFAPSVSRAKPVVTTFSGGFTPLATTVWFSSCRCTVIGRIVALLSSPTT